MGNDKVRVAILGGGPSALATAYYLTIREPGAYDITIYEMSWRLGGKTASGRGRDGRIEEHGLHVLFGCYHNAFDMMIGCYDELDRAGLGKKYRGFVDAVEANHFGVIGDDRYPQLGWLPWRLQFPSNVGQPGDPPLPTIWQLGASLFQTALHVIFGAGGLRWLQRRLGGLWGFGRPLTPRPPPKARGQLGGDAAVHGLMWLAGRLLDRRRVTGQLTYHAARGLHRIWRLCEGISGARRPSSGPLGRAWAAGDLAFAMLKGLIRDQVLTHPGALPGDLPGGRLRRWARRHASRAMPAVPHRGGFEGIDNVDYRAWLRENDASDQTCDSPLVRIVYDAAFSYPDGGGPGERGRESMAAGALVRICLLMALTYKRALYFKMRAGMGDIVAAPLYRLLGSRGVKFKFLHRVTDVRPSPDGKRVDEVRLSVLARTAPGREYDPLVELEGLDCWPSAPPADRIHPDDYGDACRAEKFFADIAPKGELTLRSAELDPEHGFDKLVFAIPVACINYVCGDLIRADERRAELAREGDRDPQSPEPVRPSWGEAARLSTVQTAAVQLWCKETLDELGWPWPSPLLSLFLDPLNTYADMRQILENEPWSTGRRPRMIAYFCGAVPHLRPLPAADDPAAIADFYAQAEAQKGQACDRLLANLAELWPRVYADPAADGTPAFNWSVLFDPLNRRGPRRLEYQYVRSNVDPQERCTLALPDEGRLRLEADDTGFENLVVAGDWVANGIYAACFEGAVQGGLRAARAVAGPTARGLYTIEAEQLLNVEEWTWRGLRSRAKHGGLPRSAAPPRPRQPSRPSVTPVGNDRAAE